MKIRTAALGAAFLLAAVFLCSPIKKVSATSYTTLFSQWIQGSLIDSTPVGATTPSTGNFTTLALNGAAPSAHTLCGNGSSYVDSASCGYTSGSNSNGFWTKDPSGHIHQWGHVSSLSTGSANSITFPTSFTTPSSIGITATDDFFTGGSVEVSIFAGTYHTGTAPTNTGFQIWVSSSGNGAWWTADGF